MLSNINPGQIVINHSVNIYKPRSSNMLGATMIPKIWLALSLPMFGLAAWLLARTIQSLVRQVGQATIVTLPLAPSQEVSFPQNGAIDLYLEGRRGANLSGLDFTLSDGNRRVPLDSLVIRTTVSGLSRVRLKVRSFELDRPGRYTLDISGIRPGMDQENRVVFARPIGGVIVTHVMGLVALGIIVIGSLAGSILPFVTRR
jgi:hypothetical protein